MSQTKFRPGDRVRVLWGFDSVEGEVVEVWDDPAQHVRVRLELGGLNGESDAVTVLLLPNVVQLAHPA